MESEQQQQQQQQQLSWESKLQEHLSKQEAQSGQFIAEYVELCTVLEIEPIHQLTRPAVKSESVPSAELGAPESNAAVERLMLNGGYVDEQQMRIIGSLLHRHHEINTLMFSHVALNAASVSRLAESITSSSVRRLFLDDIKWMDLADVASVTALLTSTSPVQLLSLRGDQITDDIGCVLAEQLKTAHGIAALLLWNNQLRDNAALALAQSVLVHPALVCLDVSNNSLSDVGAGAMLSVLRPIAVSKEEYLRLKKTPEAGLLQTVKGKHFRSAAKTLKVLGLSHNQVSDTSVLNALAVLRRNPSLHKIALRRPDYSSELKRVLNILNTSQEHVTSDWPAALAKLDIGHSNDAQYQDLDDVRLTDLLNAAAKIEQDEDMSLFIQSSVVQ